MFIYSNLLTIILRHGGTFNFQLVLGTSGINCDPCNISYEYNADNYPVRIIPNTRANKIFRRRSILHYQQP